MTRIFCTTTLLFALTVPCAQASVATVEVLAIPCLMPLQQHTFQLCDDLTIRIDEHHYIVPRGFKTDLASIPRPLWSLYSPIDYDSIVPSILHDWHYCCEPELSREDADTLFYYALRHYDASPLKATLFYLGVRLFGRPYYQQGKGILAHHDNFKDRNTNELV